MRIEPAPHVFRNEDRRQRFNDRRGSGEERRADPVGATERAKHEARPWFAPAFAAHLLGQANKQRVPAKLARRAYLQPEARTPLRPSCDTEA
jgi:hypothetical protein